MHAQYRYQYAEGDELNEMVLMQINSEHKWSDKVCPEEQAGVFSLTFFSWLSPFLAKGERVCACI